MLGKTLRRISIGSLLVGASSGVYYASLNDHDEREEFKSTLLGVVRFMDDAKQEEEVLRKAHVSGADLVLKLCQKNGGMFVKFAQHASSLKPAVPDEYVEVLSVLQDKAPERSIESIRKQIRSEFSESVAEEIIAGMDQQPIGVASLAQVHKVVIKTTNHDDKQQQQDVVLALKIKHRNIKRTMESDILLFTFFNDLAALLFDRFSFKWAIDQFENNIKQELDTEKEMVNAEKIRELVLKHPFLKQHVLIPFIDRKRSSPNIIAMEFIKGAKVKSETRVEIKQHLSQVAVKLFAYMIFNCGFVHCDPHFGNFVITSEGKLGVLDHGLYRQLDPSFLSSHSKLWSGILLGSESLLSSGAAEMKANKYFELFPLILTNRPINSTRPLGSETNLDDAREVERITKKFGFQTGMSLMQFSQLAVDLPVDFLFVLRVMHLIKDLHREFGGTNKERFIAYAEAASVGCLDVVPPQSIAGKARFELFNVCFYFREFSFLLKERLSKNQRGESNGQKGFSLSGLMRKNAEEKKKKKKFMLSKLFRKEEVK